MMKKHSSWYVGFWGPELASPDNVALFLEFSRTRVYVGKATTESKVELLDKQNMFWPMWMDQGW